jgi:hypothetical protein
MILVLAGLVPVYNPQVPRFRFVAGQKAGTLVFPPALGRVFPAFRFMKHHHLLGDALPVFLAIFRPLWRLELSQAIC